MNNNESNSYKNKNNDKNNDKNNNNSDKNNDKNNNNNEKEKQERPRSLNSSTIPNLSFNSTISTSIKRCESLGFFQSPEKGEKNGEKEKMQEKNNEKNLDKNHEKNDKNQDKNKNNFSDNIIGDDPGVNRDNTDFSVDGDGCGESMKSSNYNGNHGNHGNSGNNSVSNSYTGNHGLSGNTGNNGVCLSVNDGNVFRLSESSALVHAREILTLCNRYARS